MIGKKNVILKEGIYRIDPKAFFGSSKASTSKTSSASKVKEEPKPVAKEPVKPAPKKRTAAAVKAEEKEEAKPTPKTAAKKRSAEETKPAPRKARAKAIVISDSEGDDDDYEAKEEEEDDYVEEDDDAPAVKKAKREKSFEEPKKAEPKKTTKTSNTAAKKAAAKDEAEAEEAPKKKNNYFARMATKEGPKALGTRPEPVGAPNCLNGLAFVCTGEYDTLSRDQIKTIVMRYGGRITGAVSGKTDYLCIGRDPGESKTTKAKSLGTKLLDEDAFYKLVETSAAKEVEYAPPPTKAKGKGKESDTVLNTP